MSAIAGILYCGGAPIERGLIESVTAAMASRGPDGRRHWSAGSVALGHGMLRATPESLEEHQPLMSRDGTLTLVWDGRLDNRDELRRGLIASGSEPRDNSDAELVLQSYAAWGEDCPARLLGDFAFAVWDATRNRLFCARDHMGARPFFYSRQKDFFAFASEEEALIRLPGISRRPSEEMIDVLLLEGIINLDASGSWLDDVSVLPPAGYMEVSASGAIRLQTYWRLAPADDRRYASDEACIEAFLDVFGKAVRCRLRSSGNVATMMSGGLDSAGIAAMTKRQLPHISGKEFHAYSAISDHPETCVESKCIRSLTVDLGDRAHVVAVPSFTGMLSVDDLVDVGWSRAHPIDNAIVLPAMMCLAAHRNGHRVMLHGVCGDLTMYVPNRYIAYHLLAGRWARSWSECSFASRNFTYLRGTPPVWLLLLNLWTGYAPGWMRAIRQHVREMRVRSLLRGSMINREPSRYRRMLDRVAAVTQARPLADLQQAHIHALLFPPGIRGGLEGYDRVGGRFGLELRDPWADKRVVEFFLRLPLQYKARNGWTKYLMRTGFVPDLAPEIRWRTGGEHLGWHFIRRLMDETRDSLSQILDEGLPTIEEYVDHRAVRAQYLDYRARPGDENQRHLYDILTLIRWVRRISRLGGRRTPELGPGG
ncbi:MAG: hypothetical protein A3G25_21725 [Betaproteobacteria bacterium RIFCSPLOWO2_12_FULL_63_13]|nr:MAG: hypothetical protein A3H32_19745 [Betaproteobacteria bacterium RIFCSPLOWO2_02_FULL_63_19]OGA46636.1 MAG: hypothetical protein A3G25_21725 [Betaproteobacteria bacterium RIFCSPLOWO2_12_FULL_63_13]